MAFRGSDGCRVGGLNADKPIVLADNKPSGRTGWSSPLGPLNRTRPNPLKVTVTLSGMGSALLTYGVDMDDLPYQ